MEICSHGMYRRVRVVVNDRLCKSLVSTRDRGCIYAHELIERCSSAVLGRLLSGPWRNADWA